MRSYKSTPTLNIFDKTFPDVSISFKAMSKMQSFIAHCADEIGWLGTAFKEVGKNHYIIDDVLLFDQEVHSTTTELTPQGLGKFAEEIIHLPGGVDLWNSIKVWGHSHVMMAPSPSGQDESQMKVFSDCGHDWFIRIIANKKGEMKVDIFHYEMGVQYLDVPFTVEDCPGTEELHKQISELYSQIDKVEAEIYKALETEAKEDIALKVRKKTYTTYGGYGSTKYADLYGGYGKNKNDDLKKTTYSQGFGKTSAEEDKKTVQIFKKTLKESSELIETIEDAVRVFKSDILCEFAIARNVMELEDVMELYGYTPGFYTTQEKGLILRAAQKELDKNYYTQFTYGGGYD